MRDGLLKAFGVDLASNMAMKMMLNATVHVVAERAVEHVEAAPAVRMRVQHGLGEVTPRVHHGRQHR
jgi:hypothetical protein